MARDEIAGHASQELYTQFIYRVQLLAKTFGYANEFYFYFFFNKGFLTSPNFNAFTRQLKAQYKYRGGFMLNAGEFKGTSNSTWGIVFSGWELSSEGTVEDPRFSVRESVVEGNGDRSIVELATWDAIPVVKENTISMLIPSPTGAMLPKGSYPTTKNGFETSTGQNRVNMRSGWIGYLHNHSNNVQFSDKYVGFYSMGFQGANGIPVDRTNFREACVVYSVRKSTHAQVIQNKMLWVRDKDIFPVPTKEFQESNEWEGFVDDCVVYSLFYKESKQTSLRDYYYGTESDGTTPKKWRVENQFFWESKDFIRNLAIENKIPAIEKDLATDTERYVYSYLKPKREDGELSDEADSLLSKATEILVKSFKYREIHDDEVPRNCSLAWDAGWVQIQRIGFGVNPLSFAKADDELQALYTEFKDLRSALGEKIAMRYSEDTGF